MQYFATIITTITIINIIITTTIVIITIIIITIMIMILLLEVRKAALEALAGVVRPADPPPSGGVDPIARTLRLGFP